MRHFYIYIFFSLFLASSFLTMRSAQAVTMMELIKDCSDDRHKYCEGVAHGDPLQACLTENRKKLTPACGALVDRLSNGESVSLF